MSVQQITKPYTISVLVPLPIGIALKQGDQVNGPHTLRHKLWRTAHSLVAQGINRWEMVIGVTAQHRALVSGLINEWINERVSESASSADSGEKTLKYHFKLITCPVDEQSQSLKLAKLIRASEGDWVSFAFAGDRFAPHFVYECLMRMAQRPSVEMVYFDDDVLKVRGKGARQESGLQLTSTSQSDGEALERYSRIKPQFKPDFSPDFLFSYNYIGLSFVAKRERLLRAVSGRFKQSLNFPWQLVLAVSDAIVTDHKQHNMGKALPAWHEDFPIQHIGQVLRHRDMSKLAGIDPVDRAGVAGSNQSAWHETSKPALTAGRDLVAARVPGVEVQLMRSHRRSKQLVANSVNRSVSKTANALKVMWPVSAKIQAILPKQPKPPKSQTAANSPVMPKVSIIVPTKDQCAILKVCVESVLTKTRYPNYELVVVDNQTTQVSSLRYLASLERRSIKRGDGALGNKNRRRSGVLVTVMRYDKPFNYSNINNKAVAACDGEVLVFLNNDVEVLEGGDDWLTELVSHAIRPDVGCVGAKLLYPDRTIQHAGVSLGMHGVADHMYRGLEESVDTDPYGYLQCVRNTGAVTGAVMAVRRSVFNEVGGFDAKKLPVAFNDVDLCLKAEMAGYRTVWTPDACLIHHESKTRAPRKEQQKKKLLKSEPEASRHDVGGRSKRSANTRNNGKSAANEQTPNKQIASKQPTTASAADVKTQSHATERSEIAHMRKSWGRLLKSKYSVLGQRYEPLRFL